jgi:hypothetical protein
VIVGACNFGTSIAPITMKNMGALQSQITLNPAVNKNRGARNGKIRFRKNIGGYSALQTAGPEHEKQHSSNSL